MGSESDSHWAVSDFLRPTTRIVAAYPSVHGVLQARILTWVAISFSGGSSRFRDWSQVSCIAGSLFTDWAAREDPSLRKASFKMLPEDLCLQVFTPACWVWARLIPYWLKSCNKQHVAKEMACHFWDHDIKWLCQGLPCRTPSSNSQENGFDPWPGN